MRLLFPILFTLAFLCGPSYGAVTVTVNGSNHTIPQTNEKGWGTNVTAWIQAISQYTLQPSGGTFTLTAEVNTGATYGFKVPYIKTATATPSTAGVLRLARTDGIGWRNQANGANLLLEVDSSNRLTFNSVILPTATSASVQDSTFSIYDNGDSSKLIAFQASGITTATTRTITMPDANVDLGNLTNSNIASGAAIAYSKLNLSTSILNADVNASAAIATSKLAAVTASRALVSDGSGFVSAHGSTTATQIGYLDTLSANVQTALDAKQLRSTLTTKGDLYVATASATVARQGVGSDGDVLTVDSAQTNGIKWSTPTAAPSASYEISNCSLAASVAASALTIALKDSSGSDPSSGSPCKIGFRSATATTGTYTQRSITAATSVVVSNGSALGCTATVSCVLYVYAIDNAGTVVLGVVGLAARFDEGTVLTSTTEGGAGGADTGGILYATSGVASKAIRLLGRVTITPAASFAWTNAASEVSNTPFRPSKQIAVGTAQTSNGTTSSATFATPTNTATLTFTANHSGKYRIYISVGLSASTSTDAQISVVNTSGSATNIISQPAGANPSPIVVGGMYTYRIDTLVAGVSYTYELQALTSAGTLTIQFSKPTGGAALVAEQLD